MPVSNMYIQCIRDDNDNYWQRKFRVSPDLKVCTFCILDPGIGLVVKSTHRNTYPLVSFNGKDFLVSTHTHPRRRSLKNHDSSIFSPGLI